MKPLGKNQNGAVKVSQKKYSEPGLTWTHQETFALIRVWSDRNREVKYMRKWQND